MVQEFHVVRCFSCQTFQVQQVKKSKKWSCKMCGEKQSIIKEYGRGTGADCRRHVQKLNTLRGEMLEVENEQAWTQLGTEEEGEVQNDPGDEAPSTEQKDEGHHSSLWSKYMVQTKNEPKAVEEDEEEEEKNVYTEREWCRRRNNFRGKKKRHITSMAEQYVAFEKEETATTHCRSKIPSFQTQKHDGAFKSSPEVRPFSKTSSICSKMSALYSSRAGSFSSSTMSTSNGASPQSSAELDTEHQPSVSSSGCSGLHQKPSESKSQAKDSKWARFLTAIKEDNGEEADSSQYALDAADVDQSMTLTATNLVRDATPLTSEEPRTTSWAETLRLDQNACIFDKLTWCINGNISTQLCSPTFTSRPGGQKPVCVQPPPVKRPCPSVLLTTFFNTDDDFDDEY